MTTATQYVKVARVMMDDIGEEFEDVLAAAGARAKLYDYDELEAVYNLLASNSSPCWFCGKGISDNRVEYFEGWNGEVAFYAHPTCEENRSKC